MVRKRSRTSSRKYREEDNDSDSDYALETAPSEPAPKKYSLRQRKRRIFTEFEFDDDGDEIEPTKLPSDDEEFEVENELAIDETPETHYIDKSTYINHYEPEQEDIPEDSEGPIDFEDMIRADIVVNKNRIDYDHIIQKTKIKVQPFEKVEAPVQPVLKSKRGRKPKVRPEGEIDSSLIEPESELHEEEFLDKDDKDYNPTEDSDNEELIDCTKLVQAELSESAHEIHGFPNSINTNDVLDDVKTEEEKVETISAEKTQGIDSCLNSVTENLVENSKNDTEFVANNGNVTEAKPEDEKCVEVNKNQVFEVDDDDVVLIEDEKKCEVIVLDD